MNKKVPEVSKDLRDEFTFAVPPCLFPERGNHSSGSNKPYPLTRADGSTWQNARRFGSEVMGLVAPIYQLAPTADSLEAWIAGPSSSQLFSYCKYFTTQKPKCQMFFCHKIRFL